MKESSHENAAGAAHDLAGMQDVLHRQGVDLRTRYDQVVAADTMSGFASETPRPLRDERESSRGTPVFRAPESEQTVLMQRRLHLASNPAAARLPANLRTAAVERNGSASACLGTKTVPFKPRL